tara:strand:+ start:28 stop:381 length:354 start_codon:yes stop_codon:yes gene_type:complete
MKSKIVALSKKEDFLKLLKGKKISNKFFTIFFDKTLKKNNKKLNISFVTKKKIGKIKFSAVERNKIRRRLKSIMNEALKKISLNLDYSYLIISKATILGDKYINIKETLFADFRKIK